MNFLMKNLGKSIIWGKYHKYSNNPKSVINGYISNLSKRERSENEKDQLFEELEESIKLYE